MLPWRMCTGNGRRMSFQSASRSYTFLPPSTIWRCSFNASGASNRRVPIPTVLCVGIMCSVHR